MNSKSVKHRLSSSDSTEGDKTPAKKLQVEKLDEKMSGDNHQPNTGGPLNAGAEGGAPHQPKTLEDAIRIMLEVKNEQVAFRQSMEQRMTNIETNLKQKITEEVQQLRDYVDVNLTKMDDRLKVLEKYFQEMQVVKPFDPDYTVVVIGLGVDQEELTPRLTRMIEHGLGMRDCSIVRTARFGQRENSKGIVKMQMETKQQKEDVLKNRFQLKNGPQEFRRVFLRENQSHMERVNDRNWRTMLKLLPNGSEYRVTAHGLVVEKDRPNGGQANRNGGNPWQQGSPHTGQPGNLTGSSSGSTLHRHPMDTITSASGGSGAHD